jgi:hypothetical protein
VKRAAFLLAVLAVAILPALATPPDDAAYYKRTATKPPKADVYLGPGASYGDQLGLTLGLAVVSKTQPFMFTIDGGALRIDGSDGTTPFKVGCRSFTVPFSVDSRTTGVVMVGMKFKLPN